MRTWVLAILVEAVIAVGCVLFPAAVQAQNGNETARLRFSLVHRAVPRYYEMLGLVRMPDEPLDGRLLLPDIDPPVVLDDRNLVLEPSPWLPTSRSASGRRPGTYSLSNNWTAQLSYHHSVLAQTLSNEELRTKKLTDFSTANDRDVLGLQMNWKLAGSTIGLGYRFQSTREEPGSGISGVGDRFIHAFTLGFTKEWGAAKP